MFNVTQTPLQIIITLPVNKWKSFERNITITIIHETFSPIHKNVLNYDFRHAMCIFRMINKVPANMGEKVYNKPLIWEKSVRKNVLYNSKTFSEEVASSLYK
jgi:hypothetical protein